jgi:integral membrane protein
MLWIQGIAYLAILITHQPLQAAGMDQTVMVIGSIYRISFLLLLVTLIYGKTALNWTIRRPLFIMFASFIPFGLMIMDFFWVRKWTGNPVAGQRRSTS